MSIKYDSKREALAEVIKRATNNATYVIPDLQRPYVWTPRQVTLLVDSLFRGWPFGSLLLWEVKPDCFSANEGIPHRPFWQVVDRTDSEEGTISTPLGQPATYHMVLDGQQRVQSLILALGEDQWGFKLYDSDWALNLDDRRVRPSTHWSKANLCIDLSRFQVELDAKDRRVRKVEIGKILNRVVRDRAAGQSADPRPVNYIYPVPKAWDEENKGQFIRLARLWDLVQRDLSESEYEDLLAPVLAEHGVIEEQQNRFLRPLAQFMKLVENVKVNATVHALQIESFELTPQWNKDDYMDAIVNIFTRLNTAGRTLTHEEITLAWLKVGWLPKETNGKTAGECLEEFKASLADNGFQLQTDEIVRLISFVWAVEDRQGNLLDSKDLLKGDIVRSMATALASKWKLLRSQIERAVGVIKDRDLVANYSSFNGIIIALTWYRLVFNRFEAVSDLRVPEHDELEKQLNERAARFVDRWVFASEWAGVWGIAAVTNFQLYASDLSRLQADLANCPSQNLLTVIDQGIATLIGRVSDRASQYVDNIVVHDRRRVHQYYPLLWVWHRLERSRWQYSAIPMRTGRKRISKLEVDHTIADAWWQRLVDKLVEAKLAAYTGPEEEKLKVAPNGFDNRYEASTFINQLGNCLLLDKSFNISKSDNSLWSFLQQVREFKDNKINRGDWETALSLPPIMTAPDDISLADLKDAIQTRDVLIRRDLRDFIAGMKHRVDAS
jgi:uncharacterized protein DUF262